MIDQRESAYPLHTWWSEAKTICSVRQACIAVPSLYRNEVLGKLTKGRCACKHLLHARQCFSGLIELLQAGGGLEEFWGHKHHLVQHGKQVQFANSGLGGKARALSLAQDSFQLLHLTWHELIPKLAVVLGFFLHELGGLILLHECVEVFPFGQKHLRHGVLLVILALEIANPADVITDGNCLPNDQTSCLKDGQLTKGGLATGFQLGPSIHVELCVFVALPRQPRHLSTKSWSQTFREEREVGESPKALDPSFLRCRLHGFEEAPTWKLRPARSWPT
mmetsp:Transcript_50312/g.114364  ORF Transcript_50312/g.114364 Transcript_50312/m.114364 type:complete len:278 (+) Transcript_50312:2-835(+)